LQRVLERAFAHVYAQLVAKGEEGESAEQVVEALRWIAEEFDAAELLFEHVLALTPSADSVSQLLDDGGFEYDLVATDDMAAALIAGFRVGVEAEASVHDNPLFEAVVVADHKQIIAMLAEALNRTQPPPEPPRKVRIFLSYARSDDEPFVKRLYDDLKDEFDVWWDRVSMPNRGPTFAQEIRNAIEHTDRLLLVAGTGAFSSDYVKYEWMYAYEIGKAINIALRKCDYTDLPEELKNYDAPDFRKDADYDERLQTLVRQMTEPVAPMGQFHDVPALPPHFLQRPDALDALRDLVIADVNKPTLITAEKRVTAVEGMSGIGKSGLATAFAHDRKVRFAFPDGIVWVTAGRKPSLFELYRAVGIALGDELRNYRDESTARQNAQHMLQDKKCLLILDDVWELLVGRAFRDLIHGTPARLLITTRNLQINDVLNANEYRLDLIGPSQAVDYLRSWVGRDDPDLVKVAQKLGYLFLALKLAGARMKKDGLSGADYLATFDRVSRMKIDRQSTDREDSLEASIALSVDAAFMGMEDEKLLYHSFGIFQEDAAIPQQTILQLWAYLRPNVDSFDLSETLTALVDLALVERHEDKTLTLHDLLHSYAREKLGDRYVQTHQDLLDSYRVKLWYELPPDEPYLWRNIAYHLTETKQTDTLRALLLVFDWLQAKLDATNANALLSDFAGLTDDEPLRLLESGISMSAHAIENDKHQLAGQLVGRLVGHSSNHPKLASLAEQARAHENYPALLPQMPTLTPAGGPLIRTIPLEGTSHVIAFTKDGEYAVVAVFSRINVFELATGSLLTSFSQTQHTHMVTKLAVQGEIVVSGDNENTVKVWRWRDGTMLTVFTQHTEEISAVAVQDDIVVSCDSGGTVKVWRWADEELLTDFTLHTERVNAVAIQGDIVASGSWDHTVKVWRWEDGTLVTDFTQHTDKVYALAIEGEIVVSGAANGTMKAWRWEDGTLLTNFVQHTGAGAVFAVAVQGEIVVSGDGGSTVKVWRWADGELLTNFTLHTGLISAMVVRGDIVISGSCPDSIVKVWRWGYGGNPLTDFKPHQDIVSSVAVQGEIVVLTCPQSLYHSLSETPDGCGEWWDQYSLRSRGTIVKRAVGSSRVVVAPPVFNQHLGFCQRVEDLAVEQFIPKLTIEALDITILPGAAFLNEQRPHVQA